METLPISSSLSTLDFGFDLRNTTNSWTLLVPENVIWGSKVHLLRHLLGGELRVTRRVSESFAVEL